MTEVVDEKTPQARDTLVGQEFLDGQFRILAKIATGGMGSIYLADQTALHRRVAVKILNPELAHREDLNKRFYREAKATSRLTHPNTIRTYLYGQLPNGTLYIVMEYLEGANLLQVLRHKGPLNLSDAVGMVAQVAAALDEAHEAGIIHRDLKSENIFLTPLSGMPNFAKVLDFGIAFLREGDEKTAGLTAVGSVFGTPQYMSPEQAKGNPLDGRSDFYSLGVIFYEALTGKLPWNAKAPMEFITCHLADPPLPIQKQAPEVRVPFEIENVIRRLLQKKPENRYASGAELGRALISAWSKASSRKAIQQKLPAPLSSPVFSGPAPEEPEFTSLSLEKPKKNSIRNLLIFLLFLLSLATMGFFLPPLLQKEEPVEEKAGLTIVYSPPETNVFLGGKPLKGNSPYQTDDLLPGVYEITGEATGYIGQQTKVTLKSGETGIVELRLTPVPPQVASLSVSVKPKEALFVIDGGKPESVPIIRADLSPGFHNILISADGFIPFQESIELTAGEKKVLNYELIPKTVRIRVLSTPSRATLKVINRSKEGLPIPVSRKTPVLLRSISGGDTYQVELSKKGYKTLTREISLDPRQKLQEQLRLNFSLEKEDVAESIPNKTAITIENVSQRDKRRALSSASDLLAALDRDGSNGLSEKESRRIVGLSFEKSDTDKNQEVSAKEIVAFGPKAWGVFSNNSKAALRLLQLSFAQKSEDLSSCTNKTNKAFVELSIGADGLVNGVQVFSGDVKNQEERICVERIIRRMIFLPPGRTIRVAYEISFL